MLLHTVYNISRIKVSRRFDFWYKIGELGNICKTFLSSLTLIIKKKIEKKKHKYQYKIAVAWVTVWRSIIVSLYTVFPIWAVVPPRNFQKKCVSIDAKCSETHRNEKKFTPYEWHFPLPQNAQYFKKKVCLNQVELLWNA